MRFPASHLLMTKLALYVQNYNFIIITGVFIIWLGYANYTRLAICTPILASIHVVARKAFTFHYFWETKIPLILFHFDPSYNGLLHLLYTFTISLIRQNIFSETSNL